MYPFNDAAFHQKCLDESTLGKKAMGLASICYSHLKMKRCDAGGNKITNPHDWLFFSVLTSDENEELFRFNFFTLDRTNIKDWKGKDNFIKLALKFNEEGKWANLTAFDFLGHLIDTINKK
ncbi:MAG: hypothetical protein ACHQRM_01485 [Bacteroidia bacterium]